MKANYKLPNHYALAWGQLHTRKDSCGSEGRKIRAPAGETVIGKAVNLLSTGYYPNALGMTNHIHVYTYSSNVIVDPTPFFFPR